MLEEWDYFPKHRFSGIFATIRDKGAQFGNSMAIVLQNPQKTRQCRS
jgi:hypothetical protein